MATRVASYTIETMIEQSVVFRCMRCGLEESVIVTQYKFEQMDASWTARFNSLIDYFKHKTIYFEYICTNDKQCKGTGGFRKYPESDRHNFWKPNEGLELDSHILDSTSDKEIAEMIRLFVDNLEDMSAKYRIPSLA